MPRVLTTNATITCPHGGLGTSVPSSSKWSIGGGLALLENDGGSLACPFLLYPCVGYRLRSMRLNATTVDGRAVILETDFNQTVTGLPLTMIDHHPVIDDSTPAAIPSGQEAPPLSPELADTVAPVVTVAPAQLAFNSLTQLPAVQAVTFTLASDHPLARRLTLINTVVPTDVDLTDNPPPGLIVAPGGDDWTTPTLMVVVTMSAVFMTALGVGRHDLFLTGVNARGLSGYAQATLTVS